MFEKEYQKMYEMEKNYWWFVGKRAIIRTMLNSVFCDDKAEDNKLIDIGCGCGLGTIDLEEFGTVFGLDISNKALRFCQERRLRCLVQSYAAPLPFKDNTFELLLASDLLEHLEDDIIALEEFYRVVKKNGKILLAVPCHPCLFSDHDIAIGHKRRYKGLDFKEKIKKSGFVIERLTYFNMFLLPLVFFIRRFKNNGRKNQNPIFLLSYLL